MALLGTWIKNFFWSPLLENYLRRLMVNFLHSNNHLQKKIFLIYLNRDYLQQPLAYEKELHQQHEHLFSLAKQIQTGIKQLDFPQQEKWQTYKNSLESLSELIISLESLRYRVKDPTTFEVCEKELKTISQAISVLFNEVIQHLVNKKKSAFDLSAFMRDLDSFEEINRSTLQMVVNDPIIFIIFIRNLYAIGEELSMLAADVTKL